VETQDIVKLLEGLRFPRKDVNLSSEELKAVHGAVLRLKDFELLRTICLVAARWAKAHPPLPGEPAEDRELRKAVEELKALKAVESFNVLAPRRAEPTSPERGVMWVGPAARLVGA
jgi:hypothetical protein